MFSRGSKSASNTRTPEAPKAALKQPSVPSIISADLKVLGNLVSTGDLQVDGVVEGDIQSAMVTIGESAQVHGAVTAETIRVCGSIKGEVKGTSVTLAKTAKVVGDILHQALAIEQGAYIDGHCRRIDSGPASGDMKVTMMRDKDKSPTAAPTPEAKPAGGTGGGIIRPAVNEAPSR